MTDNQRRINRAATITAIVILSTALVAAGVGVIALWHDVQINRGQIDDLRAQVVELGGIPGQTVIVNPAAPVTTPPTTTSTTATPRSSATPTPPTSESKISSAPPTSTPPTSPPTSAPAPPPTSPTTPPTTAPLVCIVRPPVTVC